MDVPTSLQRGDYRKESTFRKINEVLEYLRASRLCADGQSLRMDRTSSGTILSALRQATPPPSSGDGYAGYFRVDLVEDDVHDVTVSVVDGSDETFPIAGCAYYKGNKVDCPKEEGIEIAAGFLCLYIQDREDDTYEASYEIKTTIPEKPVADDGTAWYPLAEIIGPDEDGGWYARQIHQGGIPGAASSSEPETSAGYAGYFKLYLIKTTVGETTTYKVRIADGATYQSESSVGGNSTCKVNNASFAVAPYLSAALTSNTLFYLKYNASAATVTLESSATLLIPGDTDTEAYYQLGRFYSGTAPYVSQDHSNVTTIYGTGSTIPTVVANGIPQIWWMRNEC